MVTRNLIADLLDEPADACVGGASCPDDCAAKCDAPTCPRCDAEIDPLAFACPSCAHNAFSRLEGGRDDL